MGRWLASGLAALVLGSGCSGVHERLQPAAEITIVINEAPKKEDYIKKTRNLCDVANALYQASANRAAMEWYEKAIGNIEEHKLPIKGNPGFALAYNRMAEYYLSLEMYSKAEKFARIAVENYPDNPFFRATLEMIQREIKKKKATFVNFT
ncbi:hypothetical protein KY343_04095 [Candidatus Woesearchaeota archaeon]|nr:hypothetical protein [Candidatus Woesearchaeota archaeon]